MRGQANKTVLDDALEECLHVAILSNELSIVVVSECVKSIYGGTIFCRARMVDGDGVLTGSSDLHMFIKSDILS